MHAVMRTQNPADSGRGIRGTFYPSEGAGGGGGSMGAVLPKVIGVVVAMAVVRTVIASAKHHGGSSRWGRRREAIAELHRELHAEDGGNEPAPKGSRGATA